MRESTVAIGHQFIDNSHVLATYRAHTVNGGVNEGRLCGAYHVAPSSSHVLRCFSTTPDDVHKCSEHTWDHLLGDHVVSHVSSGYSGYTVILSGFKTTIKVVTWRSRVS